MGIVLRMLCRIIGVVVFSNLGDVNNSIAIYEYKQIFLLCNEFYISVKFINIWCLFSVVQE